jgi:hypothetical protein
VKWAVEVGGPVLEEACEKVRDRAVRAELTPSSTADGRLATYRLVVSFRGPNRSCEVSVVPELGRAKFVRLISSSPTGPEAIDFSPDELSRETFTSMITQVLIKALESWA